MAALRALGVTFSHVDEQQIVSFDSIRMQILQVVDGLFDSDLASEAMSVSIAQPIIIIINAASAYVTTAYFDVWGFVGVSVELLYGL